MSLTWLSGAVFAAGLAALAALLFAMQRLRVRHRDVEVVTTLFWKAAVKDTRARVFVQRFRHPLAYALILASASLVWWAVAGPRLASDSAVEHVLVVDGSAGMGWGSRLRDALAATTERARALPRESTRVVLAGARLETMLDFGEELPLFERRAAALEVAPCPSTVQRALLALCATAAPSGGRRIEIFGDGPIDPAVADLLPPGTTIARAEPVAASRAGNAGIVSLGIEEAASGAWDRVDVLVRVGGERASTSELSLTLDGTPLANVQRDRGSDGVEWLARDVAALGGTLDARVLGADALAADDGATLVLPVRPRIRVQVGAGVPSSVDSVLRFDPGVELVEADPDVLVRGAGDAELAGVPTLELTDATEGTSAFVVRRADVDDPEARLREAFAALGLGEIDSTALADQAGREIELTLEPAATPSISMWGALAGPDYDFARSRAFPLFLARAVRVLAGVEELAFEAAAGRAADVQLAPLQGDGARRALDSLGAEFRWPRAQSWSSSSGARVQAALLDPQATHALESSTFPPRESASPGASSAELLPWIVLAALGLLALEWWLVRTERMP